MITTTALRREMEVKLRGLVPAFELAWKAELVAEIRELKQQRNALILGHNYMEPALFHFVPDFNGDSLDLSRRAAATDKDVIVFCGVRFMAETAKILSPTKQVLLPSLEAGCSLAAGISAADVRRLRQQFPGLPVVTYVNSYADVKAESDICCTSGNAAQVVASLDSDSVIFIPDEYLARNVARETGKHIIIPRNGSLASYDSSQANLMVAWPGRCEVHEQFQTEDVAMIRDKFPDALVLAHPECSPAVTDAADFTGSTSAMIRFVEKSPARRYALLTECSMGDNIAAAHPEKEMLRLCSFRCPHMKQITLEETRDALLHEQYEIDLPEDVRVRAAVAVQRMLEIG